MSWGSLLKLALIGFVAYALISAVSNVGLDTIVEEFQSADKAWLLAAIALTPLAQLPQAASTIGASTYTLRFFPSLMLQYGVQFISLAVPSSAARVALEIRFFERIGAPAAGAVTVGMIDSFSTFCIQILLMAVITLSGLASLHLFGSDSSGSSSGSSIDWQTVAIACGLLLIAFAAALLLPRFRHLMKRFIDGLRAKAADGRDALKVLREPRKLVLLLGGNLIAQITMAVILGMCLRAFGYSASLAQLILIYCFVCLFAGFMPRAGRCRRRGGRVHGRLGRDRHPAGRRDVDSADDATGHVLPAADMGVVRDALDAREPIPLGKRYPARLDPPTTPTRCDRRGHHGGLRDRRRAGRDGLGHDRGLRHRGADDATLPARAALTGMLNPLRSSVLRPPRSRR